MSELEMDKNYVKLSPGKLGFEDALKEPTYLPVITTPLADQAITETWSPQLQEKNQPIKLSSDKINFENLSAINNQPIGGLPVPKLDYVTLKDVTIPDASSGLTLHFTADQLSTGVYGGRPNISEQNLAEVRFGPVLSIPDYAQLEKGPLFEPLPNGVDNIFETNSSKLPVLEITGKTGWKDRVREEFQERPAETTAAVLIDAVPVALFETSLHVAKGLSKIARGLGNGLKFVANHVRHHET